MFRIQSYSILKFLILILMLLPAKDIQEFYIFLFLNVIIISGLYGFNISRIDIYYLVVTFGFLSLLFFSRYFFVGIEHLGGRDIVEYGRVIFLVIIFLNFRNIRINLTDLIFILKTYLIIDFCLSLFQFLSIGGKPVELLTELYSSQLHVENALHISRRALGLSPDPGSHGLMVLFVTMVLSLNYFFRLNNPRLREMVYIILGFLTILMSQSQTAFVGLLLFILLLVFTLFYYRRYLISKMRAMLFICLIFVLGGCLIAVLSDELRYLFTLFTQGLERSSYQARGEKALEVLLLMSESPYGLISGYGKEFFGDYSRAMDNEHLYIVAVWGMFIYSLFLVSLVISVLSYLKRSSSSSLFFTVPFMIGIPLAWPSSYYLVPKISLLLVLLYTYYKQQSAELKRAQ